LLTWRASCALHIKIFFIFRSLSPTLRPWIKSYVGSCPEWITPHVRSRPTWRGAGARCRRLSVGPFSRGRGLYRFVFFSSWASPHAAVVIWIYRFRATKRATHWAALVWRAHASLYCYRMSLRTRERQSGWRRLPVNEQGIPAGGTSAFNE